MHFQLFNEIRMCWCGYKDFAMGRHFIKKLNCANSLIFNCSARLSKIGCCRTSVLNKDLLALRSVFLLCPKDAFTSLKKWSLLFISTFLPFGKSFITPL